MAVNQTTHDLDSLDFGAVAIGALSTLQIVFTNDSDPTASQDIALGGLAAPFTFGSGDDAFTLAANGATHTVDITYTPTAVGTHTDDITGTTTATAFNAALPISLTGRGFSTEYSLPDIENNPAGVMKISLIVDTSLPELTIPSTVKVLHIGTLTELIDVEPGVVDVQNLELELAEDYTTYTQGFWYKVIQGYPTVNVEFKFILEEDGVDTFYFWGKVYRQEVEWPEHYISTGETDVIRSVRLRLVSLIHSIKDIAIADIVTEALTHATPFSDGWAGLYETDAVLMSDLLASIVSVGFDQTYDAAAAQVRSTDFKMEFNGGEVEKNIEDCYMLTKTIYQEAPPLLQTSSKNGYLDGENDDANNPHRWESEFADGFSLLTRIALNFGWVVRYYYGKTDGTYDAATPANNLHRLEFLTRGNSYAGLITPEKGIKQSTLFSDSVIKTSNIRVVDVHAAHTTVSWSVGAGYLDHTVGESWAIDGIEVDGYDPQTASALLLTDNFAVRPSPKFAEFDLGIGLLFIVSYAVSTDELSLNDYRGLFTEEAASPGEFQFANGARYYDYNAATWVTGVTNMVTAVMQYYNRRFSPGRRMYERTYGSLKFDDTGVTSHSSITPLKRIEIYDQNTAADVVYYATEIRKDFENNETTVLWIEE